MVARLHVKDHTCGCDCWNACRIAGFRRDGLCRDCRGSAADGLEQLQSELQKSAIALYYARVADKVRDLFDGSGFSKRLGPNRLFPGVDLFVDAFLKYDAAVPDA
jgi:hypothetical protein